MTHPAPLYQEDPDHLVRTQVAKAYRIGALQGLDDLTYTHISGRSRVDANAFYIGEFGRLFEEMSPENLIKIAYRTTDGLVESVNRTGFAIHSAIYDARPEINAVVHIHTTAGTAVAAMKCGLLPISQFAFHMTHQIGYHDYRGLTLEDAERAQLAKDLGQNSVMILRNHGLLAVGRTIHEAMFFIYHLEQACRVQCQALSMCTSANPREDLVIPPPETLDYANHQLLHFEQDIGIRDWNALCRKLDRMDSHA